MQKINLKNQCKNTFNIDNKNYSYYDLQLLAQQTDIDVAKLPYSLNILLENSLRNDDPSDSKVDIFKNWLTGSNIDNEIFFNPSRVLMQDFTGVPAIVDLAAMRAKLAEKNLDPELVNPSIPVDLVIDHSIQVDKYRTSAALKSNTELEIHRNIERYQLLKWSQKSFNNLRVVPPGTGICHQVNLEYFANVVWSKEIKGELISFPDTLVGTDSHTTMINGLGVLGWGVGGIEAESAMLGQPIPIMLPEVVGVKLVGSLKQGITATDLVLTITQILRKYGVVGKFVEYFGSGIKSLSLADRATIANMSPEYGATCGYFPIDQKTIDYLSFTGRTDELCNFVEQYARLQGIWFDENKPTKYSDTLEIDLNTISPSIAGPSKPQDRIELDGVPK
ncbi:MAG: aconitate hydratase, partial [Legionellales bacterium]|nr:aconitate hydratase [Legionellales bacterium]